MSEPAKKNLVEKLVAVMAAIDHVDKLGVNTFHKYSYVKASDLARAVRKVLIDQGVLMLSDVVEESSQIFAAKEGSSLLTALRVKFTFIDSASQDRLEFHGVGYGADKGDKGPYKAMTGALKYALRNSFLIPDESDPEADESTDKSFEGPTEVSQVRRKSTVPAKPPLASPKISFNRSANGGKDDRGIEDYSL